MKQLSCCTDSLLLDFPSCFQSRRRKTTQHVNQIKRHVDMNSVCPSVYSPIYPQKEALSMLDLMLFWLSLLDWVTKLASPFCRRLLWAAFCCLVSCLRTFWRTTSCKTNKNSDSRVLQTTVRSVCLYKAGTTVCRHVGSTSPPSHSLINCSIWKLFSNTYRANPALVQNSAAICWNVHFITLWSDYLSQSVCIFILTLV